MDKKTGVELIAAERIRQIEVEGWTTKRDLKIAELEEQISKLQENSLNYTDFMETDEMEIDSDGSLHLDILEELRKEVEEDEDSSELSEDELRYKELNDEELLPIKTRCGRVVKQKSFKNFIRTSIELKQQQVEVGFLLI